MGGGNAQKSATKREKNAKKAAAAKKAAKPKVEAEKKLCKICRTPFMVNVSAVQLQEHVDAKHSKLKFADCFPDEVERKE